jgi:hypothetical protein
MATHYARTAAITGDPNSGVVHAVRTSEKRFEAGRRR